MSTVKGPLISRIWTVAHLVPKAAATCETLGGVASGARLSKQRCRSLWHARIACLIVRELNFIYCNVARCDPYNIDVHAE